MVNKRCIKLLMDIMHKIDTELPLPFKNDTTSGLQTAFASPILCSSSSITKAVKIAFQQPSTPPGVTVLPRAL